MIKLSIVDGCLRFNEVQSTVYVCREFQKWFKEQFGENADFELVYNGINSPEWLCFFLDDWSLFGENNLGFILDRSFGQWGLEWSRPTNDKPACDLIRKAMPYQLVLALMEDNGFDFAGGALEILKAARELLAVPERWTKGVGARDSKGIAVDWDDDSVYCRCAYIAISTVCGGQRPKEYSAFDALGFRRGHDLFTWNDAPERTHAEVLARFDEAIARLEGAATP